MTKYINVFNEWAIATEREREEKDLDDHQTSLHQSMIFSSSTRFLVGINKKN